ncbi:AsnC family transcriptional regulator [Thermosyntropha sp.]|uniref:siroheme decarboxylase subunit beta n=1 Tax=Thermosyntropha sp. TaxID=2740820 RepID=UPI0025DF1E89|nr:AsnC family transcriptional regulator [Thermosyntropha sp.]MBO8159502.1 Lrp/AsnC family transcriptional regulator [Thermosyntropha sp.]
MDDINRAIIKAIQGNMPLTSSPFREIAEEIGVKEEDVLKRIEDMKRSGIIRRFGAVLRHNRMGFKVNAMTAWKVNDNEEDKVGRIMAGFAEVSHCYLRKVPAEFGYNLFTMLHATSEEDLARLIDEIASKTGIKEYKVFRSIKEIKKTSMEYF